MKIKEISTKYGLKESELESALNKIRNGKVFLYAMSGKMGAGKDTVGDLIAQAFKDKGFDVKRMSYSTPMRKEMSEIVEIYNKTGSLEKTAKHFDVKIGEIDTFINTLNGKSVYRRSPESRKAIQYWGTDVRRKQDSNYWVNELTKLTVNALNNNQCVYVSDVRFPNEADSIKDLNGKIIRLIASVITRTSRIYERDDLIPTIEQLTHESEISLDHYEFDTIFNGKDLPQEIADKAIEYIGIGDSK